jgi:hypothetical protein
MAYNVYNVIVWIIWAELDAMKIMIKLTGVGGGDDAFRTVCDQMAATVSFSLANPNNVSRRGECQIPAVSRYLSSTPPLLGHIVASVARSNIRYP